MCVKKEVWTLPPSDAVSLLVNMLTAARRLQNGIFNILICLWVYLIPDPHVYLQALTWPWRCCLLWSSLIFWFPAQLALPGDLGHLNQGRWERREAICQMSISRALGRCPSSRLCAFKLLSSGRGGGRGGGQHGQPPGAGGRLERGPNSTLFSCFLSPWNSTNIPLVFKIQ